MLSFSRAGDAYVVSSMDRAIRVFRTCDNVQEHKFQDVVNLNQVGGTWVCQWCGRLHGCAIDVSAWECLTYGRALMRVWVWSRQRMVSVLMLVSLCVCMYVWVWGWWCEWLMFLIGCYVPYCCSGARVFSPTTGTTWSQDRRKKHSTWRRSLGVHPSPLLRVASHPYVHSLRLCVCAYVCGCVYV